MGHFPAHAINSWFSGSIARPSPPMQNTPCRKSECFSGKLNPSSGVPSLWMNGICCLDFPVAVAQLWEVRRRMRLLTFTISFAVCVLAGTALAQSHWKARPSVGEEFTNSAVVIVGRVISAKDVMESGGFIGGTLYSIQVAEVFKGSSPETIELYSENSSGRFPMAVGTSYLIFAYKAVFEGVESQNLAIDNCGNSGTLKQSKEALMIVRKLRPNTAPEPS
jgi:hypothetical protein